MESLAQLVVIIMISCILVGMGVGGVVGFLFSKCNKIKKILLILIPVVIFYFLIQTPLWFCLSLGYSIPMLYFVFKN